MRTQTRARILIVAIVVANSCSTSNAYENEPDVEMVVVDEGEAQQDEASQIVETDTAEQTKSTGGEAPDGDAYPIVFDEQNEGKIEELFSVDTWNFEGTEGQTLALTFHKAATCFLDIQVVLVPPGGERDEILSLLNGCKNYGPFSIEESGTYRIEITGGRGDYYSPTGEYVFTPQLS